MVDSGHAHSHSHSHSHGGEEGEGTGMKRRFSVATFATGALAGDDNDGQSREGDCFLYGAD